MGRIITIGIISYMSAGGEQKVKILFGSPYPSKSESKYQSRIRLYSGKESSQSDYPDVACWWNTGRKGNI